MLSSTRKIGRSNIYISSFRDIVISIFSLKMLVCLKRNPGKDINKFGIRSDINLLKFTRTYKKGQYY